MITEATNSERVIVGVLAVGFVAVACLAYADGFKNGRESVKSRGIDHLSMPKTNTIFATYQDKTQEYFYEYNGRFMTKETIRGAIVREKYKHLDSLVSQEVEKITK